MRKLIIECLYKNTLSLNRTWTVIGYKYVCVCVCVYQSSDVKYRNIKKVCDHPFLMENMKKTINYQK